MTDPTPTGRRFYPTPAWLIYGLLVVEGLLWLSERFQWFGFNEKKGWTVLIAVATLGVILCAMLLCLVLALVFRLRFQFSIRTMLILTIAVALPFSWLAVEMREAREQKHLVTSINDMGREVAYDWQVSSQFQLNAQPPQPAWLRGLLGNDFFADVSIAGPKPLQLPFVPTTLSATGADVYPILLAGVTKWKRLQHLDLEGTPTTDADLQCLRGNTQLDDLSLAYTQITDNGLQQIVKACPRLTRVNLAGTRVTDIGIRYVCELRHLRFLDVGDTAITDACLECFKDVAPPFQLWLSGAKVTRAGVKKLRQRAPYPYWAIIDSDFDH